MSLKNSEKSSKNSGAISTSLQEIWDGSVRNKGVMVSINQGVHTNSDMTFVFILNSMRYFKIFIQITPFFGLNEERDKKGLCQPSTLRKQGRQGKSTNRIGK